MNRPSFHRSVPWNQPPTPCAGTVRPHPKGCVPVASNPNEDGAGYIQQGFLEGSNVDPVKELVGLIKTQRSFELNSQSIQTADQALQTVANLRRG